MKLVQLESPNLLKGSWVWKTSNGVELDPIFSTVGEGLIWYETQYRVKEWQKQPPTVNKLKK